MGPQRRSTVGKIATRFVGGILGRKSAAAPPSPKVAPTANFDGAPASARVAPAKAAHVSKLLNDVVKILVEENDRPTRLKLLEFLRELKRRHEAGDAPDLNEAMRKGASRVVGARVWNAALEKACDAARVAVGASADAAPVPEDDAPAEAPAAPRAARGGPAPAAAPPAEASAEALTRAREAEALEAEAKKEADAEAEAKAADGAGRAGAAARGAAGAGAGAAEGGSQEAPAEPPAPAAPVAEPPAAAPAAAAPEPAAAPAPAAAAEPAARPRTSSGTPRRKKRLERQPGEVAIPRPRTSPAASKPPTEVEVAFALARLLAAMPLKVEPPPIDLDASVINPRDLY
ncbi:hypothetical protein JL720_14118 [Aureococcus anophagefferens]|nr:hypothetical protein JL720_14118 [Aureococcus anophagefferens]